MPQINVSCKASMHIGKKWSAAHNRRTYDKEKWNLDGHIQADRSDLNVTLCDTDYKTWFHQAFDAAIDEYNAKNAVKHSERLIDKDKYCAEQSGKVQECIIQLGDHQTYMEMVDKVGVAAADQLHIQFLTDAFKQWQQENPSFRIFSAIIHMDETKDGTPHLHLDFMPVAQSKRGLAVKVSVDGALKEIGFDRKKDQKYAEAPYRRWLGVQRERIETLAAQYVDLIPSEHDTGKQHIETWQYRSQQARVSFAQVQAQHTEIKQKVEILTDEQQKKEAAVKNLTAAIADAENRGAQLNEKLHELERKHKTLTEEEIKELDVTPRKLVGGFKGLTPDQAQQLLNTAELRAKLIQEQDAEIKRLNAALKALQKEHEALKQKEQGLTMKEWKMEIEQERKFRTVSDRLNAFETVLKRCPQQIQDVFRKQIDAILGHEKQHDRGGMHR